MPRTHARNRQAVSSLCGTGSILFFTTAPKPGSHQEQENEPRIIQWLLGKKIVNVLVPFTKPQPKKVTQKIPERKQCSRLGLRHPSCGRQLWPSGHTREGGGREVASPSPSGL